MGRIKKLNESEKKKISEVKQQRLSVAKISKVIRRSRRVIHNFLKNVEDYGKKKSTGRPSLLSDRDRLILRVASNSQLTTKQIMEKCSISATVSSVRRVLLPCKNIKRLKLRKKHSLTTKHKVERLRFAKERTFALCVGKRNGEGKRNNASNSTTNGRRQRDGLGRHRLFRQNKYQVHRWENE
ncbi:uncharacterized protein LOC122570358 [Bombus pyrosoma]|uniref:uncharacterized protein LOC122570358 n=1 Tax=Bombus pyrosoma TaxID=396416 RepID=UPI001CB91C70|nr:uncharacterized protein LOC122570358 [Bombus pyrosoma]